MNPENTFYQINGYSMGNLITEAEKGELFKFEVRNLIANLMRDWLKKYDTEYSNKPYDPDTEALFYPLDENIRSLFDALGHSAIY